MYNEIQNIKEGDANMDRAVRTRTYEAIACHEAAQWELTAHYGDGYEIVYAADGETTVQADGWRYHLLSGDLLLLPPDCLRRYVAGDVPIGARTVIRISKRYLSVLSEGDIDLRRCFDRKECGGCFCLHAASEWGAGIGAKVVSLERECRSQAYGAPLLANGILLQLMVELNRAAVRSSDGIQTQLLPDLPQTQAPSAMTAAVLARISSQYDTALTPEQIASALCADKSRMSAAFRRETGISVHQCITLHRLMRARRLLAEGLPAGEVSIRTGFGDYAGFFRAFKAEYGISPRVYAEGVLQTRSDSDR